MIHAFDRNLALVRIAALHGQLLLSDGMNQNDRANVMIAACIEAGITIGADIRGVLTNLGFHDRHLRILMAKGRGRHFETSEAGHYRLIGELSGAPKAA